MATADLQMGMFKYRRENLTLYIFDALKIYFLINVFKISKIEVTTSLLNAVTRLRLAISVWQTVSEGILFDKLHTQSFPVSIFALLKRYFIYSFSAWAWAPQRNNSSGLNPENNQARSLIFSVIMFIVTAVTYTGWLFLMAAPRELAYSVG